MNEEELYNDIVEKLSSGDFLQLNGKAINLTELNEYINAQQEEIERLNNIINEFEDWLNAKYEEMHDIWYIKVLNKLKELKRSDK